MIKYITYFGAVLLLGCSYFEVEPNGLSIADGSPLQEFDASKPVNCESFDSCQSRPTLGAPLPDSYVCNVDQNDLLDNPTFQNGIDVGGDNRTLTIYDKTNGARSAVLSVNGLTMQAWSTCPDPNVIHDPTIILTIDVVRNVSFIVHATDELDPSQLCTRESEGETCFA